MKISKTFKIIALTAIALVSFNAKAEINLGNLLNTGINAIQNATATSNFEAEDLVGTWTYASPAVSFKGDNALSNIGGAAGSAIIEEKLAPYYQKLGFQNSQLTVNQDLTFTWKIGAISLSGTIEKTADSNLKFNFSALGKISIGSVDCIATKSISTVSLTFDASKILSIAQKVSSLSSNSSFQTINSLLQNYKDMYIGAKLSRVTK